MTQLQYYCYRAGIKAGDILLWLGIAAFVYGFFKQSPKLCVAALIVLGSNLLALRILSSAQRIDERKAQAEFPADSHTPPRE